MKIINLTEEQYINYHKKHSSRNYIQSLEYAKSKSNYNRILLGVTNDNNRDIIGATIILEKNINKFKTGLVPGGFLIDYNNEQLFKDFINTLKRYLKKRNYIYLRVENQIPYKIFDQNEQITYFNTNIIKLLDKLSFTKIKKENKKCVILETEITPAEIYKTLNSNTKRNIKSSLKRAITIHQDENRSINTFLNVTNNINTIYLQNILNNFTTENNKAEIYFAKINPEKYINNYHTLLKNEDEINSRLNSKIKDININKTLSLINKKMQSDKLINKYNNEIRKATNAYIKYPDEAVIGAILIIKNDREIYFLDEAYNKNLANIYSSHLIKWEIIKKYSSQGYKIFNFGNVKSINKKNGNYFFKSGFGSKVYEYIGTYDLIINKQLYKYAKLFNITTK